MTSPSRSRSSSSTSYSDAQQFRHQSPQRHPSTIRHVTSPRPNQQATDVGQPGNDRRPHFKTKNEHFVIPHIKGLDRFSRKGRKVTKSSLQSYPGWEQPPQARRPYHEYVHQLVEGGWDNLRGLDEYLTTDIEDQNLVISVLDITDDYQLRRWPDIHDERDLNVFLREQTRVGTKVRWYMVEQQGPPASSIIEAFGSALNLDPRFFQWTVHGSKHVFTPSQRRAVSYTSIGFAVLTQELSWTSAERFQVMIYVVPDSVGDGWTGIVLFSSHTKIQTSSRRLLSPPKFTDRSPNPMSKKPKSLRELYLETFDYADLDDICDSPFCAIEYLLALNYLCWNEVITATRDEDRRAKGFSNSSIGHGEDIRKTLDLIERFGSSKWKGRNLPCAEASRNSLREDFKNLLEQTELLWKARGRMMTVRQQRSDARNTALTNAFTYIFAPITLMTGIYGMNVAEINDSPLGIWQPFTASVILNIAVIIVFASYNWLAIHLRQGRRLGFKEAVGFALGFGENHNAI